MDDTCGIGLIGGEVTGFCAASGEEITVANAAETMRRFIDYSSGAGTKQYRALAAVEGLLLVDNQYC